jgi:hypothetical protein
MVIPPVYFNKKTLLSTGKNDTLVVHVDKLDCSPDQVE